jgi:hypothetical protein
MKGSKKTFLKTAADVKLIRTNRFLRILILILGIIVIYDSFIHATLLYYVLFLFAGMIAGRIYDYIYSVENVSNNIKIRSNRWNIILTLVLVVLRFFVGKPLLESVHVAWAYDAIYLFFIGLYHSKLRVLVSQIDNMVYNELCKLKP